MARLNASPTNVIEFFRDSPDTVLGKVVSGKISAAVAELASRRAQGFETEVLEFAVQVDTATSGRDELRSSIARCVASLAGKQIGWFASGNRPVNAMPMRSRNQSVRYLPLTSIAQTQAFAEAFETVNMLHPGCWLLGATSGGTIVDSQLRQGVAERLATNPALLQYTPLKDPRLVAKTAPKDYANALMAHLLQSNSGFDLRPVMPNILHLSGYSPLMHEGSSGVGAPCLQGAFMLPRDGISAWSATSYAKGLPGGEDINPGYVPDLPSAVSLILRQTIASPASPEGLAIITEHETIMTGLIRQKP